MLITGEPAADKASEASIGAAASPHGGPSAHAAAGEAGPSPSPEAAAMRVPLPPFRMPLHGVQHLTLPGQGSSSKDDKSYILDLMPKVRCGTP